MSRAPLFVALAACCALIVGTAVPGRAQPLPGDAGARAAPPSAGAPEPLVHGRRQARPRAQARVRPQIRVQPRYLYRRWHSPYPLPYATEFPGPYAVRHCVNRYVAERRPSGTVIVPRLRCWWAPG